MQLFIIFTEGIVQPVGDVSATSIVDNFEDGRILVKFEPSVSLGIVRYIINCTDNTCEQAEVNGTQDSVIVQAGGGCTGVTHTVSVYAVNKCGRESANVTRKVKVHTFSGHITSA